MLKLGSVLEANPRYIAAVKAQQARERARRDVKVETTVRLVMPFVGHARISVLPVPPRPVKVEGPDDSAALYQWFLNADFNSDKPSIYAIKEVHARRAGLTVEDIDCPCRKRRYVEARQDAIADAWVRRPDKSPAELARDFCRDHATIYHVAKMYGLSYRPAPITAEDLDADAVRSMYLDEYMPSIEIALRLGAHVNVVRKITRNLCHRDDQYQRNRRRISMLSDLPVEEIARQTGFKESTVVHHLDMIAREAANG